MIALGILFVYAGKKVMAADPLERPKGIVLVCETGINMIYNYMKSIMPGVKFEKDYYPYFAMTFVYIFIDYEQTFVLRYNCRKEEMVL